jgi:DNA-binding response OmpR family regulator
VRILIIEDETKVANALRAGLEAEHYEVTVATTGEEGFFLANQASFDLLLLDLMLPRRDGIDVLATLRKRGIQTPIFVLTAKDTVEDRVIGLDQARTITSRSRSHSPSCSRASGRCCAGAGWIRSSSCSTRTSRWIW